MRRGCFYLTGKLSSLSSHPPLCVLETVCKRTRSPASQKLTIHKLKAPTASSLTFPRGTYAAAFSRRFLIAKHLTSIVGCKPGHKENTYVSWLFLHPERNVLQPVPFLYPSKFQFYLALYLVKGGALSSIFKKSIFFFFINRLGHVLKVYSQNIMTQLWILWHPQFGRAVAAVGANH